MANYGKITHYDANRRAGMISPEDGSDALPFDQSGLQQEAQEPRSDQLYTFETETDQSGRQMAVNLQMEQGENARQESPRDHGNQGGFDQQGQSQNRANQEAERRPPVDAQNAGQQQQGASDYQPLRSDSNRDDDRSVYGDQSPGQQNQSQSQSRSDHEGVSRAGVSTQDAGVYRGSQSDHEGSPFQPMEQGRDNDRGPDTQRGNPSGQNQQGLNEGSQGRRDQDAPRGNAPDLNDRQR